MACSLLSHELLMSTSEVKLYFLKTERSVISRLERPKTSVWRKQILVYFKNSFYRQQEWKCQFRSINFFFWHETDFGLRWTRTVFEMGRALPQTKKRPKSLALARNKTISALMEMSEIVREISALICLIEHFIRQFPYCRQVQSKIQACIFMNSLCIVLQLMKNLGLKISNFYSESRDTKAKKMPAVISASLDKYGVPPDNYTGSSKHWLKVQLLWLESLMY